MSIAISIKVNDGLVLAADSATTIFQMGDKSQVQASVVHIYEHANKVFNLRKGLPIGLLTWGGGSIGISSIATLVKDLRALLVDEGTVDSNDWWINPESYTIKEVAGKLKRFMFEERYVEAFKEWPNKPDMGFIVAGYSSAGTMAEEYEIDISNGTCEAPHQIRGKSEIGMTWRGEPEAITRLFYGHGRGLPRVLKEGLGVPEKQIQDAMEVIRARLQAPLLHGAMPIQDAIGLAEFLVHLTIQFSRYTPGAPTVGGPIEVAAITKHEGFKWNRRKHYYSDKLNPEGKHDGTHKR